MQATVMTGDKVVGRAHDVVRVDKFSVDRLVLENTSLSTTPWEKPLVLVVGGKSFKVRFSSWRQCSQDGDHLVFRDISFNVID